MKKRVKAIAVILTVILTQYQIIFPSASSTVQTSNTWTLRPRASRNTTPANLIASLHNPVEIVKFSQDYIEKLIEKFNATLMQSALAAGVAKQIKDTKEQLENKLKEAKKQPSHMPFIFPEGHRTLPIRVKWIKTTRRGVILSNGGEEDLNVGLLQLDELFLYVREVSRQQTAPGTDAYPSKIGLYIHNTKTGEVIEIDRDMLRPDDPRLTPAGEKTKNIIGLEDAGVIERDDTIYVFLTCVVKDEKAEGGIRYYAVVTTHDKNKFIEIARSRRRGDKTTHWQWSRLKRLLDIGVDHKNFVPWPNPDHETEKWLGSVRTSKKRGSLDEFVESEEGLDGKWKLTGQTFVHTDPKRGWWCGASTFVFGMPNDENGRAIDIRLEHAATRLDKGPVRENGNEGYLNQYYGRGLNSYYDIWAFMSDRNTQHQESIAIPILQPDVNQPYEAGGKGWIKGAMYVKGARLIAPEKIKEEGLYIIDLYPSGSDSVVLWTRVMIATEPGKGKEYTYASFVEIEPDLLGQIRYCEDHIIDNKGQPLGPAESTFNSVLSAELLIDQSA